MAKATYVNSVVNSSGSVTGGTRSIVVKCDLGDRALSGGFDGPGSRAILSSSRPTSRVDGTVPDRWTVEWWPPENGDLVDAFVLCSDFPPEHQP